MGSFVADPALAFGTGHDLTSVDAVIVAEIVPVDVPVRVMDAFPPECLDDTAAAAVDAVVLELHNRAGAKGTFRLEIASKGRNRRHHDNDLEVFIVYVSTQDTIDDGFADLVVNRSLLVGGGCDEELPRG